MASISVTNTFANGATADASEVNTNFSDIINGTSDGTKDLSVAALTCASTVTFNGNVTIGNATSDTVTFTGRVTSDVIPITDSAYDLGTTALRWAEIWADAIATTGNITVAGNVIPAAAKGIDFSANTESAVTGTTLVSELLDWYEEGTWTPLVSSSVGAITSYTSSGTYIRIGKLVTLQGAITITDNGTGSSIARVGNLPFNVVGECSTGLREAGVSGKACMMYKGSASLMFVFDYANVYPWATGATCNFSITYKVA